MFNDRVTRDRLAASVAFRLATAKQLLNSAELGGVPEEAREPIREAEQIIADLIEDAQALTRGE
jgi:hypothetical protein